MEIKIPTFSMNAKNRWRKSQEVSTLTSMTRRGRGSVAKAKTNYTEAQRNLFQKIHSL